MKLYETFVSAFPKIKGELREVFTPYRVCPIGAHVDHQYGLISGFALDRGVTMVYHPEETSVVRLRSVNFDGEAVFTADGQSRVHGDWGDYARAVAWALTKSGYTLRRGFTGVIMGTLPVGGLSSSAAVIITYIQAFCRENDITLTNAQLIDIALIAEHDFIGLNVGKLDQSCEVLSRRNHLLYLDTKDDTYELIPRHESMPDFEIAIFFSGVERTLVGSKFNARVDELKAAAYAMMAFSGMDYGKFVDARLRQVPREIFEEYKDRLPEDWMKRATHFYTEFDRVRRGAEAWRRGDLNEYGKCVFESGYSSIYNYETGSPELKALYEAMTHTDGIYGGRFSGAGFKGCCMALVHPDYKEEIERKVTAEYLKKFPKLRDKFEVHFCNTADGCGTKEVLK